MKEKLNLILVKEYESLNKLLSILDEQHIRVVKNDVFGMEAIVKEIEKENKAVAELEMERRKLTQGRKMSDIIQELNDENLDKNFRNIKMLLQEVTLQKDNNELLIKQRLGFTTQMLRILSPDRSVKTYNAYGKKR
ncbi:MAG: flgN [Clostridiaceae bacterium]|jgi:flagellar biosynthesis/type III secretory pathway chaperone|nr:flgN [Clostridiaceae bacterium]